MRAKKTSNFHVRMRVLLCTAALSLGATGCTKSEPKDVVVTEYASQHNNLLAKRLEGAWVVDGKTYFEREFGDSTPKFIDELLRRRKVGYVIGADTIEYWVTTPAGQYISRAEYTIATPQEKSLDIRVIDDGKDDSARQIAGQADALRFTFVDDDHVEFRAIFEEEEADAGARSQSVPLKRLAKEDFEEHFQPSNKSNPSAKETAPERVEAPDVAKQLHGAWVMDHDATVAGLPKEERPMDGFAVRFPSLTFVFDAEGNLRIEELEHHETGTLEGEYRVVRGYNGLLIIEFWTPDSQDPDADVLVGTLRLEVLDDERISIMLFNASAPKELGLPRVLTRVDEDGLKAYRDNPPNKPNVSDDRAQALAKRLSGAWLVDTDKSLAQLPKDARATHRETLEQRAVGLNFQEDGSVQIRVSLGDTPIVSDTTYVVLDAREDAVIVGLKLGDSERLAESLFLFQGDDHLLFKPTSRQEGTQAAADREAIVLERVSTNAFEKHFEETTTNVEESVD